MSVCSDGLWKWNWFSGSSTPFTVRPSMNVLAVLLSKLVVTVSMSAASR